MQTQENCLNKKELLYMKIDNEIFNEKELQVIDLINKGKTFPEIGKIMQENAYNIKYLFSAKIAPRVFKFDAVRAASKKSIVVLKKEFKENACLVGRTLGTLKNRSFVFSKLIVVDTMFKTTDNTDYKPLKIQEHMVKNENDREMPTPLSVISEGLNIKENELSKIINILFDDKVFMQDGFVISTNKRLANLIPNYFYFNDDGKKSIKDVFEQLKKDKRFKVVTKRTPLKTLDSLMYYIRMQNKYFGVMPFLRYEKGYELRKYFYKQIVPQSLDVNKIIFDAKDFMQNTKEDLLCIDEFLEKTNQIELDNDIVRTILIDSGFFAGVVRQTFCLKKQAGEKK